MGLNTTEAIRGSCVISLWFVMNQGPEGQSVMMACAFLLTGVAAGGVSDQPGFQAAVPIWPEGRETERNLTVRFRAVFDAPQDGPVALKLTASTVYRAFVNGRFVGYGPARAAHDYYRMDAWDITEYVSSSRSVVAIEAAGYNVNSYYLLDQPSFLQAEVVAGGDVLAATGSEQRGFEASPLTERVQKVQRYSFQRPFIEVYRLTEDHARWRTDPDASFPDVACAVQPDKHLLPRRVPYPRFVKHPCVRHLVHGTVETGIEVDRLWKDRALTEIGPNLGGFPEADLDEVISDQLQRMRSLPQPPTTDAMLGAPLPLAEKTYRILDLGTNRTGFIGATLTCDEPCRVHFVFDEILTDQDVDFRRMGCVQAVTYDLPQGTHRVESFEPYTLRYLKLLCVKGSVSVSRAYLREYGNSDVWEAHFACGDDRLNRLFEAGRETFAQNAVDVFMDCPSRERAGWLCDSFFTARAAFDLSGDTRVERVFFENYALPERFDPLPDGMLPMCYPADHPNGVFIPNWALWFVVQLGEYIERSGDTTMAEALRAKILALFAYFEPFKNEDGLLEGLENWVFVEWSAANRFVQDVNYPTNMLFAQALRVAGGLYGLDALTAEAERVRATVREQSFDGAFFVDNAMRTEAGLDRTENRSEVCQYFAFYFDVAAPESYPELWRKLVDEFGPGRKEAGGYPDVHAANSFIGNMVRVELLSRAGLGAQILDESIDYLLYMADRTGTLWENVDERASCNHGFASHVVHTLYRDVLGLYRVDPVRKEVVVRIGDVPLDWCRGAIPLSEGRVTLRWRRVDERICYRVEVPAGYRVVLEEAGDVAVVPE